MIEATPRLYLNHRLTGKTRHHRERIEHGSFWNREVSEFIVLQVEVEYDVAPPRGSIERSEKVWRDATVHDFVTGGLAPQPATFSDRSAA